ncbi:hypothetical protein RFI_23751 [Reticulomyxa filosa]|uniref:Uncharacterized protein n=1 Tax=Reticulomyxa filosa TaxID=46433 RepID=X6MIB2_RETFI|nr:hypothetical protein RFI_23751 [Reticulomyxa filosa]|eukprot:ETO13619.1 hypothetical protein RFI_23751 [Reticulomyxa filosa]
MHTYHLYKIHTQRYILFMSRIQKTFSGTGFKYSTVMIRVMKVMLVLMYVSIAAFIIYALSVEARNLSEKELKKNIFIQVAILLTMFLIDFFEGILLIYLFIKRLYELLKQSYKETYRSKMYVHDIAKEVLQVRQLSTPERSSITMERSLSVQKLTVQSGEYHHKVYILKWLVCACQDYHPTLFGGGRPFTDESAILHISFLFVCLCLHYSVDYVFTNPIWHSTL